MIAALRKWALWVLWFTLSAPVLSADCQVPAQAPVEQPRTEPGMEPVIVTSREQHLIAMRAAKMRRIEPYRLRGLERGLAWVEQKGIPLLGIRFKGFQPRVGGLPTGSGFALGTSYALPETDRPHPELRGVAVWSTRGYQLYGIQVGRLDNGERGASAFADLAYRYAPQEDFFGLGPDSRVGDRSDFLLEQASYEGVVGYRFASWLKTTLSGGFLQVNTGPGTDRRFPDTGRIFSENTAPGLAAQPDFLRLRYDVVAEYRDTPGNAHRGGMVAAAFSRLHDRGTGSYSFNRLEVDARQYVPLGSTAVRVLALRFYASSDQPDSGASVPFYFQETLGGGDALRGFREYRFRDRNLFFASGEYRWEPVRAVELVLFYDAGKVFSRRSEFGFDRLRKSAGAGIRFKTQRSVVLRIDAARSSEGTRVYFKFGPSF